MQISTKIFLGLAVTVLVGCQSLEDAEERDEALMAPIDCATAEGDLRVLEGEKQYVAAERAAGSTRVAPAGHVVAGITEYSNQEQVAAQETNTSMFVDQYQQAVDEKIAKIKAACGL